MKHRLFQNRNIHREEQLLEKSPNNLITQDEVDALVEVNTQLEVNTQVEVARENFADIADDMAVRIATRTIEVLGDSDDQELWSMYMKALAEVELTPEPGVAERVSEANARVMDTLTQEVRKRVLGEGDDCAR